MLRPTKLLHRRLRGLDEESVHGSRKVPPRAPLALVGGIGAGVAAALALVVSSLHAHRTELALNAESLRGQLERSMETWESAAQWIAVSYRAGTLPALRELRNHDGPPRSVSVLPGVLWFGVVEPAGSSFPLVDSIPKADPSLHEILLSEPAVRSILEAALGTAGAIATPPLALAEGPCKGDFLFVVRRVVPVESRPLLIYSPICLDAFLPPIFRHDRSFAMRIRAGDRVILSDPNFEPPFSTMLARGSVPHEFGGQTWTLELRTLPFPFGWEFVAPAALLLGIAGMGVVFFAWARWEDRDRRRSAMMLESYRQSRKQTHFLAETSRLLAWHSDEDPATLLPRLAARAIPILGTGCGICLLEGDSRVRVYVAHANPQVEAQLRSALADPLEMPGFRDFLLDIARTHGKRIPDSALEHALLVTSPGTDKEFIRKILRWCVAVPMIARGRPIGAVVVRMKKGRRYGPRMVRIIHDFGSRIAMALDRARLLSDLQQAVRAREEFLSIASHELLTPLTALQANVQSLIRLRRQGVTITEDRLSRSLDVADRQLQRLSRLVHELLDVSRIESGRLLLHPERFDLAELVEEIVGRYESEAERLGCTVTADCPRGAFGHWDRHRIEQVVTNLLSNALKYGRSRPIHVQVLTEQGEILVRVRDQGMGIPEEALQRIFDPFERAVNDGGYGGLGLGLYIARSIAEAHDGTIEVESAVGQGSVFTLRLPRERPDEARPPVETGPLRESMH